MTDKEEDWVRKRAYALWEEEGYPSGKHDEHWQRARQEYAAFGSGAAQRVASRRQTSSTAGKADGAAVAEAPKNSATKKAAIKDAVPKQAAPKKAKTEKTDAAPKKSTAKSSKKTNSGA